jgi:hypothetical protein
LKLYNAFLNLSTFSLIISFIKVCQIKFIIFRHTKILLVTEWLLFNAWWFFFSYVTMRTIRILTRWSWFPLFTGPIWIVYILLSPWNNSSRVDMWPHSDTLSWFRAINSFLLLLINAACLVEKQHIPIQ